MRGEVLHFDEEQGFGFITGADGKRYAFERGDLRRLVPLTKGTTVEFQVDGASAREIFVVRGAANTAPARFGRDAIAGAAPGSDDPWSCFWRGVTANYFNFAGRAPRREFWFYVLFWMIIYIALVVGSFVFEAATGMLDTREMFPVTTVVVGIGFVLLTLIPWIALTVRRLHDVGMSGWFALLIQPLMFFSLGYIVLIVIGIIPSQARDNKWGPVPGVPA
jgi:uncharacterized membrane protein YhaH (DUF805 family)/cold shock CspA family protein